MSHPRSSAPTETQASDGITPERAALSTSSPAHRAAEAAQIGTWEWRLATGGIAWSPQADTIFGLSPGDFSGTFEGFLRLVHESDRPQLQAAIQTAIETRQPYHLDHRIVTPNGIIRWVSCRGRAVLDSDGHVAGMAGTTEDITRRKETELALLDLQATLEHRVRERTAGLERAVRDLQEEIERRQQTEAALKASEQRYHALYEHNPTMYFTLTPDGTVLSVNRFGAEELGYRESELVGQSVFAVFQAADHPTVLEQLRVCSQSPGRTFDWEIQKVRKDGHLLWVKERARAITGPDGNPIILIVCEDITEQRQTQELIRDRDQQLQATSQFLHTLVQESPLPIVSLDASARITSWNQAATRLFGWTKEEVLGRELPYVPPGQEAEADALWSYGTHHGIRGPLSLRRQRKDGKLLELLLWPVFVEDTSGQLKTAVGLYVDQSDLRRAEDACRHSEGRLRSFLNALDDLAFELDEHGVYLNVWTRNDDLLLLPRQEIVGKSMDEIHGREAGTHYRAILRRVLDSGTPESVEYSLHLNGRLRHFSAILSRIPASASTRATVACIVRDVSENRRSAEALHLSEQHLKSIIETSPECVKLVAADGTLLQMNAAGLAMIEADNVQDVIGRCIYPLIAESHRDAFRRMNEQVCRGQKESMEFEVVGLRGTRRWMETHAVPLRNPSDGTMAQLAITRDITDRKQTELALRESEQRFEIAFRSSPHPVLITELATGRCLEVNDTALQLFGFQRHEAVGQTTIAIELWPKPEDRTRFVTQLLETGTLRGVEFTFQTKDRRLRHCLVSSELIELNGTRCILTVGTDVTEKKEAEAALRESEERWQRFVADAPVGLVVVGADKHILSANKAFCALTGYTEQEVISHTYALYTHPDDLPKNLVLTDEFFTGQRQAYTYEKRYIRKNGEVIWVSVRASHLTVHGHDAPLVLAVVEDITDRKQALADRERISQDLHDNILQSLYAVGMQLEAGKLLAGKAPRKSKQHVTQAIRQLNHLVLEVRQFITDLTCRTAPTLDFTVALNQLAASCSSETRTAPELIIDPTALTVITPAIGEQLLSIAREALSNSVRHAGATHRAVSLTKTGRSIRLRVTDDGTGFDPGRKRRRGHGLANMAARARTIGAQFTLDSTPDRGTSVTIDVPTGEPHAC
ncbi:MAG: PAS domain S-box protein [Nitrospira sp.]|nr:PAS domain S-box protein [Nitrospira sp.]